MLKLGAEILTSNFEKIVIFFEIEKVLMEINVFWNICHPERTHFPLPNTILPSVSVLMVGKWIKPLEIQCKNNLENLTVFPFMPNLVS